MKNHITLITLIAIVLSISSCQEKVSEENHLIGKWHAVSYHQTFHFVYNDPSRADKLDEKNNVNPIPFVMNFSPFGFCYGESDREKYTYAYHFDGDSLVLVSSSETSSVQVIFDSPNSMRFYQEINTSFNDPYGGGNEYATYSVTYERKE